MRKIKLMPVNEGHELPSNGIFIEVDDETFYRQYGETVLTKVCKDCEPLSLARQTQAEAIAALEQYIREYDLVNN